MSRLTNDIQAVRELWGLARWRSSMPCGDFFQSHADDNDRLGSVCGRCSLSPLIRSSCAFFRPANFSLVARHPAQLSVLSALRFENLSGIAWCSIRARAKTRFTLRRHQHRLPEQKYVADDALGDLLPLMQVMAGLSATVVRGLATQILQGTMTLGEFVAFNGYLGYAHVAVDGHRLHGQPVPARHPSASARIAEIWTRRFHRATVLICDKHAERSGLPSICVISPLLMTRSTGRC